MLAIVDLLDLAFAGTALVGSSFGTTATADDAIPDSVVAETSDEYNEFYGTDGDDIADGQGSHDYLDGRSGNDTLNGGDGDDHLHGDEGDDQLSGDDGDMMSGGADADRFEITSGTVSIMDYTNEDVLVVNYDGLPPALTTQSTADGIMLLADGAPVAALYGLVSFDIGNVEMVAA